MLFLTRLFGVTASDAERDLAREQARIQEITALSLLLQAHSAADQHRPLGRGTHVKGVCARAQFEVFDVTEGRDPALAARLAKGIFARPGMYPATVRFGNADPRKNSDFKPDVRSMSFSVDLTQEDTATPDATLSRQDFSLQNTTTLAHKRLARICRNHEAAHGIEAGRRPVVSAVQGQVESLQNPRAGTSRNRTRRSNRINNSAMGATYLFVTDQSTS